MIPILPSQAWREFRGTPDSKGLNQTTHLACIEDPNGQIHRCYVKLAPIDWPTPLTESIAWLLAESLNLPRPGFAALVVVPVEKLRAHMPLDQHWLRYPEALGFCAEVVQGRDPTHGWKWLAWLRTKSLYKKADIARISAFDQWVENQDRHTGNLLIRSSGECVPIDNEHILYSLLWPPVGLQFRRNSLVEEAAKHMNNTRESLIN
jgi:phosphoinositide 3-/4-kinase-like protein